MRAEQGPPILHGITPCTFAYNGGSKPPPYKFTKAGDRPLEQGTVPCFTKLIFCVIYSA